MAGTAVLTGSLVKDEVTRLFQLFIFITSPIFNDDIKYL